MEKGLVIASFGTTVEETRRKTISHIERRINEKVENIYSLRAFTSRIIVNRLKKNDGFPVFNEKEAYAHLLDRGIPKEDIYIQPLHILPGVEYKKLTDLAGDKVGLPLFSSYRDLEEFVDLMDFNIEDENALVLFGHGTYHKNDIIYDDLQEIYRDKGYNNIFIVCVEGNTPVDNIINELKALNPKKVIVQPLMIVAGVHAIEDMDSDDEGSLRSVLEGEGFKVESRMWGLGEYDEIADLFAKRAQALVNGEIDYSNKDYLDGGIA